MSPDFAENLVGGIQVSCQHRSGTTISWRKPTLGHIAWSLSIDGFRAKEILYQILLLPHKVLRSEVRTRPSQLEGILDSLSNENPSFFQIAY
jgi:hypothetical protein